MLLFWPFCEGSEVFGLFSLFLKNKNTSLRLKGLKTTEFWRFVAAKRAHNLFFRLFQEFS